MRSQNGFSLLEIIIAITIIIIFTVLPILAYTSYMKKSRDEKRKSDISKISQALESYKAEKGSYPTDLQSLVTGGFMPEIPLDPLSGQKVPWDQNQTFGYQFSSPDGTSYSLMAQLENSGSSGGGTGNGVMVASNLGYLTGSFIGSGSGLANGPNIVFTGQVTNGNFTGTFSGPVNGSANGTISGSITGQGLPVTGNITGSATGSGSVDVNVSNGGFTGTSSPVTLTGTSGSGSGTITAGGALTGTFSGSGSGAVTSSTISFTGQVSGGTFTGTFSGPVTGGANGSISGSVTMPGLPVTGNAAGTVTGTCSITGTVSNGNVFNGNVTSCNLAGSGGGSVVIANPPNPIGIVVPIIQLTLDAQASITPGAPTVTGYIAPTGFGTITLTPSPTNTSTPTPTVPACAPPQCANPPAGCVYAGSPDGCSCGALICTSGTPIPTATPIPKILFTAQRVAPPNPTPGFDKVCDYETFEMSETGTGVVQATNACTNNTSNGFYASYSNDHTCIVYTSIYQNNVFPNPVESIYVTNAPGKTCTLTGLKTSGAYSCGGVNGDCYADTLRDATFSADKTKIYFSKNYLTGFPGGYASFSGYHIISLNATTGASLGALTTVGDNRYPAVSPDGTKIVYASTSATGVYYEIWVMNTDGSGKTQLTNSAALPNGYQKGNFMPSFSPDGTKIVFLTYRERVSGSDFADVYVMNANGTGQTMVANYAREKYGVSYSGANDKIVIFESNVIYTVNSNGTGLTKVSPSGMTPYNFNAYGATVGGASFK